MKGNKKVAPAGTEAITSKELIDLSSEVAVRLSHLKPTEEEFNLFVRMIRIGTLLPVEENADTVADYLKDLSRIHARSSL